MFGDGAYGISSRLFNPYFKQRQFHYLKYGGNNPETDSYFLDAKCSSNTFNALKDEEKI